MQGCKKYQIGRCQIPEGVPIFLGEIKWGCQISWGAKYPVTTDYAKTTFPRLNHGLQPEILAVKGFGFQKKKNNNNNNALPVSYHQHRTVKRQRRSSCLFLLQQTL